MSKPVVTRYVPQLPDGWVKCPRFGDPRFFEGLNIIPCKVPLSRRFDPQVGPSGRWTLVDAIRQFRGYGMEVATVIDLTKSRNYYDFMREMEQLDYPPINYIKIECRGRGQAPQPSEVNEAVWHIFTHTSAPETQNKYILLHCTHGFNRTGYIVVSALMRLRKDMGMNVRRALQRFADARPPGIYKDHYISDLFKYYREAREARTITPAVPRWKGNDDADDVADAANEEAADEEGHVPGETAPPVLRHEDIWSIGERVCQDEATFIQQQVCGLLPLEKGGRGGPMRFPGMQPVSLSMDRLRDLPEHRYHVTWKADGTRYMMLILSQGAYIMDRSFNVVRCEMRFMNGCKRPQPGQRSNYPVGKTSHLTLLDGEMVLDHDPEGKQPPRLRYLIYDVCMINANPLIDKPFKERYRAIESDIIRPRHLERKYIDEWRGRPWDAARSEYLAPPLNYDYAAEPFSVRQKQFWPVWQIDKVFERFHDPHKVGHESDGLILQGFEHHYNPGTCELLYKWKFSHMNSVDFLLRCKTVPGPDGAPVLDPASPDPLELLLLDNQRSRGANIVYIPVEKIDPGRHRVEFPEDVDPLSYDGKLVECTFDRARGMWLFMRERRDKDTPNAARVYPRIMDSIIHHVDQELLVGTLKEALLYKDKYASDRSQLHSHQLEVLRRDVAAWHEEMQLRQQQQQMQMQAAAAAAAAAQGGEDADDHRLASPGASPGASPPGYQDRGSVGQESSSDQMSDYIGDHFIFPSDGMGQVVTRGGGKRRRREDEHEQEPQEHEQVQHERPRRRLTRWPPDTDEPHPDCPAYEGYGFD